MSKKAWIIFGIICAVVLAGLVFFSTRSRIDVSNIDPNALQPSSEASGNIADHVFGKVDSPVVLQEYGDFQCPGCESAYPTVKKLSEKYKDQLAFVFRNFPITSKHPNAKAAAAAAEAAGLQGKYWEMHDMLYEGQNDWQALSANERTDFFAKYADTLGLNVDTFKKDMTGDATSKKIGFDQAIGKKAGVDATPTFYLNGQRVADDVWQSEQKFEEAIVNELKAHNITLPDQTAAQ